MFGRVNFWRIAELKLIGEIMFSKWIDFGHKDTIYKLKFGWLKFGESWVTPQFCQTFLLPNIPAIWYIVQRKQNDRVFNHKLMENPARLVTIQLCVQPNVKAAKKSLGNQPPSCELCSDHVTSIIHSTCSVD